MRSLILALALSACGSMDQETAVLEGLNLEHGIGGCLMLVRALEGGGWRIRPRSCQR